MNIPHIDKLMKLDWALQSWDNRYNKGIWVAIAPSECISLDADNLGDGLDEVRSSTSDGDVDMITATDFLFGFVRVFCG
jgi:hypothetical protein